jgi:hypothetical protein
VAGLAEKKKAMAIRQLLSPSFGEGVAEKKKATTITATVAFFLGSVVEKEMCSVIEK